MLVLTRYLMWLALGVWIGSILFFGAAVAPAAFAVLPSAHDAGILVGATLRRLHLLALAAGVIYLAASLVAARLLHQPWQKALPRDLLVILMMALTLILNTAIMPRMDRLRVQIEARSGSVTNAPATDPQRRAFDRLHVLSTRIEGGVLLIGLSVLYLTVATV